MNKQQSTTQTIALRPCALSFFGHPAIQAHVSLCEKTDGLYFVDFTNFQFVFSLGETRRRMRAFHSEQTIRKKVQKNKDQTCNELQLIFLGSEKQPLFECKCECNFECNCRFSWFSEILSYCQKPLKNKDFPTSIVSYLSFSDASSPVSRTTKGR